MNPMLGPWLPTADRMGSLGRRTVLAGIAVAPLVFVASCENSADSPAPKSLALTNARLIDGTGGPVIENATVLVSGDRITAAGNGVGVPDGAEVLDLRGKTVLPGLIDAHVHLGGLATGNTPAFGGRALTDNYAEARSRSLAYGVTTVRSVGDFLTDSLAVRDEIARGAMRGPRIIAGGPSFQVKGGHPNGTVWANDPTALAEAARTPATAAEAARMVDQLATKGVDLIKVIMSSMVMPTGGNGEKLPWEVVQAIVVAAHRNALKVAVHTENAADTARAVELGVDDIEHLFISRGTPLTDESVYDDAFALMVANRTVVCPTMIVNVHTSGPQSEVNLTSLSAGNKLVKRAYDSGVTLAVGSDAHTPELHGWGLRAELVMMVNDQGIPALHALKAVTKTNAEILGLADRLGTIEKGKLADLLVVSGNPAEKITDIANVQLVVQGGKTVVDNTR